MKQSQNKNYKDPYNDLTNILLLHTFLTLHNILNIFPFLPLKGLGSVLFSSSKQMYTFIQHRFIKLIKGDSKDIYSFP